MDDLPVKTLQTAIDLVGGSQAELARRISTPAKPVRQQHVWNWLNRDGRVPPSMVQKICAATGGGVKPSDLAPDLYPEGFTFPDEKSRAAA